MIKLTPFSMVKFSQTLGQKRKILNQTKQVKISEMEAYLYGSNFRYPPLDLHVWIRK